MGKIYRSDIFEWARDLAAISRLFGIERETVIPVETAAEDTSVVLLKSPRKTPAVNEQDRETEPAPAAGSN